MHRVLLDNKRLLLLLNSLNSLNKRMQTLMKLILPHVEGCVIDTNLGEDEGYFTNLRNWVLLM